MDKSIIRKKVLEKRKLIKNKQILDEKIKNNLLSEEIIRKRKNILVYVSLKDEVDTISLIKELFKLEKNVYVPKVIGSKIVFYKINSLNELKIGSFNILEPTGNLAFDNSSDSCIIVPGLLFDNFNNRLGYGKGYYDRFLSNLDIYKIGICYQEFKVAKLKTLKHDVKMDKVITER